MSARPSIGDYAIIGDSRTAALVSREGSLDWLCLPRFDSPSVFGAILDARRGGRFAVHPVAPSSSQRRYVGDTNVLETTFQAPGGVLRLTDFMPVATEAEKRRQLWPEHEVLRLVECVSGEVEVEVACDPRPDYGRARARFEKLGALGYRMFLRTGCLMLRSDLALELSADGMLAGRERLAAGDRRWIALGHATDEPAVLPMLGAGADERLRQTLAWWEGWAARCSYAGTHREAVVRSALALKLMAYAPSGAVIAAPTTSLPEVLGGSRNWDYRYCWLRDASFTTRALFELGYGEEATAFLSWLLQSTRLTWPELQIMYDVYGGTQLKEEELTELEGLAGSRPVRIGNAAKDQLQLDIYGEVVEAAAHFVELGGHLDRASARMLLGLGTTVCERWREPDEGIWEVRSGRRHHTFSKAMCWVALDRLIRLHEKDQLDAPMREFSAQREAIGREIEEHGYNERLGSYVAEFDGDEVDASLLLLGLHGYADPRSARMRSTSAAIRERLGVDGLLYRYPPVSDGLPGREGAFGICSFWACQLRALQGEKADATAEFEHLLSFANDVGLFAEEIAPDTGAGLGNFPQAFTHIGLINAALALDGTPLPDASDMHVDQVRDEEEGR